MRATVALQTAPKTTSCPNSPLSLSFHLLSPLPSRSCLLHAPGCIRVCALLFFCCCCIHTHSFMPGSSMKTGLTHGMPWSSSGHAPNKFWLELSPQVAGELIKKRSVNGVGNLTLQISAISLRYMLKMNCVVNRVVQGTVNWSQTIYKEFCLRKTEKKPKKTNVYMKDRKFTSPTFSTIERNITWKTTNIKM